VNSCFTLRKTGEACTLPGDVRNFAHKKSPPAAKNRGLFATFLSAIRVP
jgi:hypothetical protein